MSIGLSCNDYTRVANWRRYGIGSSCSGRLPWYPASWFWREIQRNNVAVWNNFPFCIHERYYISCIPCLICRETLFIHELLRNYTFIQRNPRTVSRRFYAEAQIRNVTADGMIRTSKSTLPRYTLHVTFTSTSFQRPKAVTFCWKNSEADACDASATKGQSGTNINDVKVVPRDTLTQQYYYFYPEGKDKNILSEHTATCSVLPSKRAIQFGLKRQSWKTIVQ
jgi:hypothetical protein